MSSKFNHTNSNELKPEVSFLYGGRRRLIRRFSLGSDDNIADTVFRAYGDADLGDATSCFSGYASLKLIGQKVLPNEKGPSVLEQVFETLTAVLAAEGEAVLGRDVNDILVAKVSYIGLPAATGGLSVGGAFTVGGVLCVVSELEIQENNAFKRVNYVAREVGSGAEGAGEKQVGGDEVSLDANNRHTLVRRFTQKKSAPYVAGVVGSVVTTEGVDYVLASEVKTETASTRNIVRTYLEATGTWTPVGPDKIDRDMNGLLRVRLNLVAKAGTGAPSITVGETEYVSGGTSVYLARYSDAESDDAVSRIVVEYLEPGEVAASTSYSNNGALELRSVTWIFSSPETPSGYVLVGSQETNVSGYPTVEYRFARGSGQVVYSPSVSNNGALATLAIRHLTDPTASNPISTPSGYVRVEGPSYQEADGHRVWTASFAKGDGQIAYNTSSSANGALMTVAVRHLSAPAASNPISTPSGYVLVEGPSYQEADGHRVWTASFAKGTGEISRSTQGREDGTVISVRALSAPEATNPVSTPSGYVLTEATPTEADGHRVWNVQFVKGNDVTDYDLNGLKRRTVTAYYAVDATLPEVVVGTTAHPTDTALILARLKDVPNDVNITRTAVYLKPGVISKSRSPGEIMGTVKNTWQSWLVDPTNEADMTAAGAGAVLAGVKTAEGTENVQGYPVLSVTTLSGTIVETKATYQDTAEVLVHGTVTPVAFEVDGFDTGDPEDPTSGTVVELVVVPPKRKTIPVTVTISVTDSPPNDAPTLAYNLDNISCSATRTTWSRSGNGQRVLTNLAGTQKFKGQRWSASASSDVQTFPMCIRTAESATGTIAFVSDWYDGADGDSSISPQEMETTIKSKITCTGASEASYSTSGLLQRKVRHILTALDGTKYWEVVTFTAVTSTA